MRVLLVNDLPLDGAGGTEIHVARLADGLRARGDDVAVFAGAAHHRGVGKALDLWDPWVRDRLGRAAAEFRPDVIHHHNVLRELSVSVLGVPASVPSVMTVHDLRLVGEPDPGGGRFRHLLDAAVKRPLDLAIARRRLAGVIAVSAEAAHRLVSAGFRQVVEIPGFALSPTAALQPVTATQDFLFAGKLSPDKGIATLLAAFSHVSEQRPRARLLVAGAGPLATEVQAAADRLPPGAITALGQLGQDEMSAQLASVRCVVIPSLPGLRPEGTPLIALEAAMHGRPVIASDDPGLRAIIDRLGCGLLVEPGNQAALIVAMLTVCDDDAAAAEWGAAGAATAPAHYGADAVIDRIRSVYQRLR